MLPHGGDNTLNVITAAVTSWQWQHTQCCWCAKWRGQPLTPQLPTGKCQHGQPSAPVRPEQRKQSTIQSHDKAWAAFTKNMYTFEDVPQVEFVHRVFTRMPGESYCRRLRSLSLYLCYAFQALISSLVCWLQKNRQKSEPWFSPITMHQLTCLSCPSREHG